MPERLRPTTPTSAPGAQLIGRHPPASERVPPPRSLTLPLMTNGLLASAACLRHSRPLHRQVLERLPGEHHAVDAHHGPDDAEAAVRLLPPVGVVEHPV